MSRFCYFIMGEVRAMMPVFQKVQKTLYVCMVISLGSSGIVSCSKKDSKSERNPRSDDQQPVVVIKPDQMTSWTSGRLEAVRDVPGYSFGGIANYRLALDTDTTLGLAEASSATICPEASKSSGPFVTLISENGLTVSTDTVRFGQAAKTTEEWSTSLKKGDYNVVVTFYADSDECEATLDFRLTTRTEDTRLQDGSRRMAELMGSWIWADWSENSTFESLTFTDNNRLIQAAGQGEDIQFAVAYEVGFPNDGSPDHMVLTVLGIEKNDGSFKGTVGSKFGCFYTIASTALMFKCREGSDTFPGLGDIGQRETFAKLSDSDNQDPDNDTNPSPTPSPEPTPTPAPTPAPTPTPTPTPGPVSIMHTNLNLPIPDADPQGISDTIVVGSGRTIRSLMVYVSLTHPYMRDLVVEVIHPSGRVVRLRDRLAAGSSRLETTYMTSNIGTSEPLDVLKGLGMQGTWTLRVIDHDGADVGTLLGFGLVIE